MGKAYEAVAYIYSELLREVRRKMDLDRVCKKHRLEKSEEFFDIKIKIGENVKY